MTNTKQNKTITIDYLQGLEDILQKYVIQSQKIEDTFEELFNRFIHLYLLNNTGACKKIIKTIWKDSNKLVKYCDFIGLQISYKLTTEELTIRKFEDFKEDAFVSYKEFLKIKKAESLEESKHKYDDLQFFKTEYKKKLEKTFSNLNERQKAIFKQIVTDLK
jgi:hypothetical protein